MPGMGRFRPGRWLVPFIAAMALAGGFPADAAAGNDLTFEQRVAAQRAIERVYYAHQVDARIPFEQGVPDDLLERKVLDYLRLSAALEQRWGQPMTSSTLRDEAARIARSTRMPDRLLEIYEALGNDPVIILECLARPALAARLARAHFASDPPRQPWDEWWTEAAPSYDHGSVPTVARPTDVVPSPRSTQITGCPPNDTWDTGGALAPQDSRQGHTAVWTGSRMLIWGGFSLAQDPIGASLNTGVQYDPLTDTSTPTTTLGAPSPRVGHTAVWTGSRMIVWGGGSDLTGASYDPMTDTWSPTSTAGAPSLRVYHTAVWTGSRMLIWGGIEPMVSTYLNTGAQYDPGTDQWTPITTVQAASGRYSHTAVWTGDRMIVWGGIGDTGMMSTGGKYDPQADAWTPMGTSGEPAGRLGHSAVWMGGRMIIWGGHDALSNRFNSGGLYDPVLNTWVATSLSGAPVARYDHTAVDAGGFMIVWGGEEGLGSGQPGTGARFNPVSNTWSPIEAAGAPKTRSSHTAVWTGGRMVVWGGDPPGGDLYARYDPATDTWASSAYFPRGSSSLALWTGSLMIIGDGHLAETGTGPAAPLERYDPTLDTWTAASTIGAPIGTGPLLGAGPPVWTGQEVITMAKRYNPATDVWTPISTVGAPSPWLPVTRMVGLWTGSRMILWWPGQSGRYDPATDTWAPISSVGQPPYFASPEAEYEGVWTGSRMVVWGASDGLITYGGRYDPATDTWSSVSQVDQPARRANFGMVWAGGRMVVWGGHPRTCMGGSCSPSNYSASGGSYEPITDVWTPFTGIAGREQVTAVSTGTEAIFWGGDACGRPACEGSTGPHYLDGFRINPQTGDVQELSTVNAPSPRAASASVWTGEQMLVWGGVILHEPRLDGARFGIGFPGPDADADGFDDTCDCLDADPSVYPGALQLCGDGLNNDCSDPQWPALNGTNEADDDGDGFLECGGDCDDQSAATHPGAPEVNDGKDNQCPGDSGFGSIDEVTDLFFTEASSPATICWLAQPGASAYRLALAGDPFLVPDQYCNPPAAASCTDDTLTPIPGSIIYYLVHADSPLAGSWGRRSSGNETIVTCNAGSPVQEFSYVDQPLVDDVPATALRAFFDALPPTGPDDYILFEIEGTPGAVESWCAQGADFYVNTYRTKAQGGAIDYSGGWNKWWRPSGGGWNGPVTFSAVNYFGASCSAPYAWCSEWGLGSLYLWIDPAATTTCELSTDSEGCGNGGRLRIRVGPTRLGTCGF
jgi:hypothetical protein